MYLPRPCTFAAAQHAGCNVALAHTNVAHYLARRPSTSARQAPFKANRLAMIKQSSMLVLSSPICAFSVLPDETKQLGSVDKGDSQKGQYLIQGSFWGGYLDPGFDERRGVGLP